MKPVEVAENLWCGSFPYPTSPYLGYRTYEFDVIVNLSFRESVKPNQRQLVIWSPIRDNSELPRTIEMLSEAIRRLRYIGYTILVHCDQGLNRAPFLCGLAADMDAEQVRELIPGCLTNPVFVNYLRSEVSVTP